MYIYGPVGYNASDLKVTLYSWRT